MLGLTSSEAYENEEEESRPRKSGGDGKGLKFVGGLFLGVVSLLLIPAAIIAGIFHRLLSHARLRPSVIAFIAALCILVSVGMWRIVDGKERFAHFFGNLGAAGDNWTELIAPLLSINLVIGSLAGFAVVSWSARNMRTTPHLKALEGSWTYKFEYRRTPGEWLRLKRRKKALATKDMSDSEKVALGINLKDDEIAYRYYTEANKQTIVTGGVGSGKALHSSTLIPTPNGFVTAGELQPHDTIFDEMGNTTEVLRKYQPMTSDHYRLDIASGINVHACGDHRWPVRYRKGNQTIEGVLNTREIADLVLTTDVSIMRLTETVDYATSDLQNFAHAGRNSYGFKSITNQHLVGDRSQRLEVLTEALRENGSRGTGFVIFKSLHDSQIERLRSIVRSLGIGTSEIFTNHGDKMFTAEVRPEFPYLELVRCDVSVPVPITDDYLSIQSITEIDDSAEVYFCFEVDSDSHLFLCTESYLVTHNTVSILSMILSDIKNEVPLISIDFKKDPAFAARLAYWAKKYGREFYHFTSGAPEDYNILSNPNGQSHYDALHSSSPAVRADMVLGMREYDQASAVYKTNMQQLLQVLFSALDEADRAKAPNIRWDKGGIQQIASVMEDDNLTDLAVACEGQRIKKDIEGILAASKGKTQIRHALDELQGQMRTLTASQYGPWMQNEEGARSIDLFELTNGDNGAPIILFSIDSDAEEEFSRYLGSLIMADITNVSARRRNASLKNQVTVYVDEFQAVPPSSVRSLLEKSRASRLAMTLSVQSFEQIINAAGSNGESVLKGILDTCGNFLIHAGAIAPSAERLAEIQGKDDFTTYSKMNDSENFLFRFNWANRRNAKIQTRKEEKWITPPHAFMNLSSPVESNGYTATAMFVTKTTADKRYPGTGAVARNIQIIPNHEVIDEELLDTTVGPQDRDDDPEIIESEVVEDNQDNAEVENSNDEGESQQPKQSKTVIANSVGEDPEWTQEDPETGDSDFKFVDGATKKQSSSLPDLTDDDSMPSLGFLDDFDILDNEEFKPQTLSKPVRKAPEPKPEVEKKHNPGELPPLEDM